MVRRIMFILIWTATFFLGAFAVWYLFSLALISILDRESEIVFMLLSGAFFTLMPAFTVTGFVLALFRRLPGTGVNGSEK
jgi:hypothetical protein